MEKPQEVACVSPQAGWSGISWNHQSEANVLARLMETQIWHPPACTGWFGGGLKKGTMASFVWDKLLEITSVWEKAAPPAITLKLDNSYVPGAFKIAAPALKLRASESVSQFMCGPFKMNA